MSTVSFSRSNHLALLHRGAEFFPALALACEHARSEIYLETYIFAADETGQHIKAALCHAAARGVAVHVLVDWIGTGNADATALGQELEAAGVRFACFNPWFRRGVARTHRKIVVIDRRLAFLGGLNINDDMISDDGSGTPLPAPRWDFAVSVSGPVVADIHAEVGAQWARQQPQTLRRRFESLRRIYAARVEPMQHVSQAALVVRDNLRNRNTIQRALLQALGRAHDHAWLVTPYFAPGRKLRKALIHAAERGVKVTLLIGVGQFRMQDAVAESFYPRLLRAKIAIVEYRQTQLHAKIAVIDDDWVTIGSSNFDGFSLFVNHEANIIVRDEVFSQALQESIRQGVDEGITVTAQQVAEFSWLRRAGNRLTYLLYRFVLQALTAGRYSR